MTSGCRSRWPRPWRYLALTGIATGKEDPGGLPERQVSQPTVIWGISPHPDVPEQAGLGPGAVGAAHGIGGDTSCPRCRRLSPLGCPGCPVGPGTVLAAPAEPCAPGSPSRAMARGLARSRQHPGSPLRSLRPLEGLGTVEAGDRSLHGREARQDLGSSRHCHPGPWRTWRTRRPCWAGSITHVDLSNADLLAGGHMHVHALRHAHLVTSPAAAIVPAITVWTLIRSECQSTSTSKTLVSARSCVLTGSSSRP